MQKRRFEILLPRTHNDGRPVDPLLIEQTRQELVAHFTAISFDSGEVRGTWVHAGIRHEDQLLRLSVDVDDTPENYEFVLSYKTVLMERFEQIEIYIASYPVDIL